ncbi:MAG: VWA domain-containing protein [Selenomonadaceae bacterium]|nr:VWA domain-containing protein [Selenomonadaceae bacterium]
MAEERKMINERKPLTEVVFILDRSGSMNGLEDDTIGGFNSMLDKQKASNSRVLISTVLFDHLLEVIYDRVPIETIKHMTREDYYTRGRTALLDAIGETVKHIKTIHKYARDEDRPDKTLFIITTDGRENASTRYNYADVKKLVEDQKEAGWEFLFLGANIDAIKTAGRFGIDASRAANYHSDHIGTRKAFDTFGEAMMCFAAAPSGDLMKNFFDDGDWKKDIERDFMSRSKDNGKGA